MTEGLGSGGSPQGEDRSGWQPRSSWRGNAFGFCKATESVSFIDPTFDWNWHELASEGIPRGAYHFFHPAVSAVDQAHFFASTVQAQELRPEDLLVADIEILTGADGTTLEFSTPHAAGRTHLTSTLGTVAHAGVIGSSALIFMDTVRSLTGHEIEWVLTYTDLSVGATLGPVAVAGYPLWIAYPGSFPASVFPWSKLQTRFWQWAAGGGIGGGDRDAFTGDEAAFQAYLKLAPPPPPPAPKPHLPSMSGDDVMYLPNGAGVMVNLRIPAAALTAHGPIAPSALELSAPGNVQFEYEVGVNSGVWRPLNFDAASSPCRLPLADVPGQATIKLKRMDATSTLVTADWS